MLLKFLVVLLLLAVNLVSAAIIKPRNADKTPWELIEALSVNSQIRGFNGTWITDDEFYYTASDRSIHKYNANTKTDSIFLNSSFLTNYGGGSSFTLSPDNTKILVRYDVEAIFRHSYVAKYDVFDIETNTSIPINQGKKLQYCAWSPVRDRLSFVYENNVYIHFERGLEVPITFEGIPGVIYNGVPDWVYEEEVLSSGSAMWWSPDGSKLAVGFFNDTEVETFKYSIYGEAENPEYQYPKEENLKYPKPGTPNPVVRLRVYDVNASETKPINVAAPVSAIGEDHILQNVVWANNNELLVTWLNRRQNLGSMQLCTYNGACREVNRFNEPNGWVSLSTPKCFKNGQNCLFSHWIDNWYQVWNLNLQTGRNEWNSRGNFTVLDIYGYDEANDKLYYRATTPGDPSISQVFSNDQCLTCNLMDVDNAACRWATASFSKGFSYYTVVCSGPNPAFSKVFETKTNTEVRSWELNTPFRQRLESKLRPVIEFHNVTLADGSIGYAKVQLPPGLDKTKNKKYPMIVFVYGGPNSVRTTSNFGVGFDGYMATNREVIYVSIDGRGTGNKGKDLLFSVNNNLGEHEVEDQIYVTKYLQTLPYVDRDRTGIWGWSYGGYMSAKTLGSDNERVYQCGIAVAPVTSWLYYDTIYTERYMGLPSENLEKYFESSVLQNVENFRTHDFLLIHGTGDDNVHYQQALALAKILQRNDILFEEMAYVDENHSIGNFFVHLYHTMDHFWVNCLNLDVEDIEE